MSKENKIIETLREFNPNLNLNGDSFKISKIQYLKFIFVLVKLWITDKFSRER